jgi:hypothetical protein
MATTKSKISALPAFMLCLSAFLIAGTVFASAAAASGDGASEAAALSVDDVWLSGDSLHISVTDKIAGESRTLELFLSDYAKPTDEFVTVRAADSDGNTSNAIRFKNPYYAPQTESGTNSEESGSELSETPEDGGVLPAGDGETSESSVPDGGNPFTPGGQGEVADDATENDGKEFFTVTTDGGNVFYLIVDRQRTSDNVYLLNAVTESDLAALAEPGDGTSESAIPEPETPSATATPEPGIETEPEPASPTPAGNSGGMGSGSLIFIILAALIAGGAGYYFKIVRPKKQAAADDDEEYDDGDAPGEPEDGAEDDYSENPGEYDGEYIREDDGI